jgi:hypothetical protein
VPLDDVDSVALHETADPAGECLYDLVAVLRRVLEVDRRLSIELNPEAPGVLDLGEDVGRAQHGFGGDAGVVEAAPAELVSLDDGGLHPELRGADRGHIPTRSRADHDTVVGGAGHGGGD